ncbi:hypothetical protein G7Y79_00013g034720 [Physcia stellaris]|nr:hypothetical protein G7Y79_00013g034720 [Physcia stellaris]
MYLSLTLGLLALAQLSFAQYNASLITNDAQLDAAISAIAASYFPESIIPSLAVAIGSASAVTGDPRSLISNLITEATPPPFLSSLPTPYQSRLMGAEIKISSLRAAVASLTTHPTSTLLAGSNGTLIAGTNSTLGNNVTLVPLTSTASNGSAVVTSVPAQIVNGTTIALAYTTSAPSSAMPSGSVPASTAGGAGGTSASSGFGVPTQVPVAAAGLLGVLGLLVAL